MFPIYGNFLICYFFISAYNSLYIAATSSATLVHLLHFTSVLAVTQKDCKPTLFSFVYTHPPLSKSKLLPITAHSLRGLSQLTLGEGRGAPWRGHKFITGLTHRDKHPFVLTFTPKGNVESPITCLPLECERTPRGNPRRHLAVR